MVFIILLVKITIEGAKNEDMWSVFLKVLMNHLQMLIVFSSFDINWPPQVTQIFEFAKPIKLVTSAVVSFDCFIDRRDPFFIDKYLFRYTEGDLPIIYIKLVVLAIMPIVMIIISYVSWSLILRIQGRYSKEQQQSKFIATMVLLLFIIHPSLTQSMIDLFNCRSYSESTESTDRLLIDLQVHCWNDPLHRNFTFYVALPCLIVWGLGIPATIFVMMRKESGKLDTQGVKQKFGFLFNGYKRNNYFWEIVIMYRKILCIFIAVLIKYIGKGVIMEAMVMLIVLLFFLQANSQRRPFLNRALNDIENLSLIA